MYGYPHKKIEKVFTLEYQGPKCLPLLASGIAEGFYASRYVT